MDLWDLTKLLFRRWYAFLPMLIASSVAVFFLTQEVKPDYRAVGHLQLMPPVTRGAEDEARLTNPWVDLGIAALGKAAILRVQDPTVLDRMGAAGLSDDYTVTMDDRATYVSIEAVARSPAQASATVRELMRLLDDEVRSQQERVTAATGDRITTLPLNAGDNATVVKSKKNRVFVVAAGVALLISVALTVGLDVLLRRRHRARKDRDPAVVAEDAAAAPTSPAAPPGARGMAADDSAGMRPNVDDRRRAGVSAGASRSDDGEPTGVIYTSASRASGGSRRPESVDHPEDLTKRLGSAVLTGAGSSADANEPSDATVVLPGSRTGQNGRVDPIEGQ